MELHDHPSGNSRQYWENTPNGKIRSYPAIQDTKAEVTVGHERAHTKLVSQGEGLLIVAYGLIALQGIAPCRNLAEET